MSPRTLGILTGCFIAAVALAAFEPRSAAPTPLPGLLLSDCDGRLRDVVIQFTDDADFTLPTYRAFLSQLPPDVRVRVVCPDERAFAKFSAAVGTVPPALLPVYVRHPMTCWSRDRWLCLTPPSPNLPATLLHPAAEAGAAAWPARLGDGRIAADLARALPQLCTARKFDLLFDAGDVIADADIAFVTPAVLRRNLGTTVASREELLAVLFAALQRETVLLPDDAPDHHAGMFMLLLPGRRAAVGSPALARDLAGPDDVAFLATLPGGPDFSAAAQSRFDAVAATLASHGYAVTRVPTAHAVDDPKVYVTCCNGLLDRRDGATHLYLPTYAGAPRLNAAARAAFASLGLTTHDVDVTAVFRAGGTLHCLVNVLSRDGAD